MTRSSSPSNIRRFVHQHQYVTVGQFRRAFSLPSDQMAPLHHDTGEVWIGIPPAEAHKLEELWDRRELAMELAPDLDAPVVIGIYSLR